MKKNTLAQKVLLIVLYSLIILMIVFSFNARENLSSEGYDKCIKWKCDMKGEIFCQKQREVNNCCLGANGQTAIVDGKLGCVFN
jgi:hypothetical protein